MKYNERRLNDSYYCPWLDIVADNLTFFSWPAGQQLPAEAQAIMAAAGAK